MATFTRRRLLTVSGAGTAAAVVLAVIPGYRTSRQRKVLTATADKRRQPLSDGVPSVVYIRDAASGEVVLMKGASQVIRKDRTLVEYLSRAYGSNTA